MSTAAERLNAKEEAWRKKLGFELQTGVNPEDVNRLKEAVRTVKGFDELDPDDPNNPNREGGEFVIEPQTKEITKKEDDTPTQLTQSKFEDLRYPYTSIDGTQDFIKFTVVEYKRKASGRLIGGPSLNSELLGNIILPIPSQLTDANSVDYGQGSLNFVQETALNAASGLVAGNVDRFKASITSGINQVGNAQNNEQLVSNWFAMKAVNALGIGGAVNFNQLTARSSGAVINPNMELLFNGPTLRNFSFQFKFTPRFQQESEAVKSIIRTFKKNMAPRKGKGTAMLKTPNVFQIQYVGKAKQYLNNIKLCALRNISTNYTADGNFTTYADGAPISSTIVLSFTELVPIYNEDYDASVGGVGY